MYLDKDLHFVNFDDTATESLDSKAASQCALFSIYVCNSMTLSCYCCWLDEISTQDMQCSRHQRTILGPFQPLWTTGFIWERKEENASTASWLRTKRLLLTANLYIYIPSTVNIGMKLLSPANKGDKKMKKPNSNHDLKYCSSTSFTRI